MCQTNGTRDFCIENKKDPSTSLHYALDDIRGMLPHPTCHSECNEESDLLEFYLHYVRQECFGTAVPSTRVVLFTREKYSHHRRTKFQPNQRFGKLSQSRHSKGRSDAVRKREDLYTSNFDSVFPLFVHQWGCQNSRVCQSLRFARLTLR